MRTLILITIILLSGCQNMVAFGECGKVDYSVTVLGTPLLGVNADRECPDDNDD